MMTLTRQRQFRRSIRWSSCCAVLSVAEVLYWLEARWRLIVAKKHQGKHQPHHQLLVSPSPHLVFRSRDRSSRPEVLILIGLRFSWKPAEGMEKWMLERKSRALCSVNDINMHDPEFAKSRRPPA